MLLLLACTGEPPADKPPPRDTSDTSADTDTADSGDSRETGADDTAETDPPDPGERPIEETRSFSGADAVVRHTSDAYFGWDLIGPGDVNGDGYDDLVVCDPIYETVWVHAGALHGESTTDDAWAVWTAPPDSYPGKLAPAGDVDGDGYDDFLVGAYYERTVGLDVGAVYEVRGAATGGAADLDTMAFVRGTDVESYAGYGLARVGDLDGDGTDDVGIGSPAYNGGGLGRVDLVQAPFDGSGLAGAFASFSAATINDALGERVAGVADLDGDGFDDVALGTETDERVYVWYGPVSGAYATDSADLLLEGEDPDDTFGFEVQPAADQDGDGRDDIAVAAPYADDSSGTLYVFAAPGPGTVSATTAVAQVWGESGGSETGESFAFGDLDADGVADLIAGSGGNPLSNTGRAYVLFGPLAGGIDLSYANVEFDGLDTSDAAGGEVAFLGDMDADGLGDFAVTAVNAFDGTHSFRPGAVYVVYGASL